MKAIVTIPCPLCHLDLKVEVRAEGGAGTPEFDVLEARCRCEQIASMNWDQRVLDAALDAAPTRSARW